MLQHEMAVEKNRFHLREKRIVTVDVRPARLHHPDLWIGEVMNGLQKKILGRREIGVEDGNEFAFCSLQPLRQSPGLEPVAIGAMVIAYWISQRGEAFNEIAGHCAGFVGRIVQQLDVQLLAGIVKFADRIDQPTDHVLFVEKRQLHGDAGQLGKFCSWFAGTFLFVLVIKVNQNVAVDSVSRQQNEHNEIWNQERTIEGIGVIKALKGLIQQMLAEVGANAFRARPRGQRARRKDELRSDQGWFETFYFTGFGPRD
jgi:hypothetical protein